MVQTMYRLTFEQTELLNSMAKRICLEFNRAKNPDELDEETLRTLCNSSLAAELHGKLNHQLGVEQGQYALDLESEQDEDEYEEDEDHDDDGDDDEDTHSVNLTILEHRMLREVVPQLYDRGSPEMRLLRHLKEGYKLRMFA